MSHFKGLSSPRIVIYCAYLYIFFIILVLYNSGFYKNSQFFNWGPPIQFFGQTVSSQRTFYLLHCLIFVHQLINNWVNSVVYPWIINNVQDPKNKNLEYSRAVSLLIINAFNIYSQVDLAFVVLGFTSQISFLFTFSLANMITSTYINNRYIKEKDGEAIPLLNV